MKQTQPLYMQDPTLFTCEPTITKVGYSEINKKKYRWIQLDATVFHPKGGGQPSDTGKIGGIDVLYVHKELLDKNRLDLFEIYHCFDEKEELSFKEGDVVTLSIDETKRRLHSRMHTAGHLLAEVIKELFPQLDPYHGNHDPDNGYVKFKMLSAFSHEKEEVIRTASMEVQTWIQENHLVSIVPLENGVRGIQIRDRVMACGGTHVLSLGEIEKMSLTDLLINNKENSVTVKYRF